MTGNIKTSKVRFVFCSGFGSHNSKIIATGNQITQHSLYTIKNTDRLVVGCQSVFPICQSIVYISNLQSQQSIFSGNPQSKGQTLYFWCFSGKLTYCILQGM